MSDSKNRSKIIITIVAVIGLLAGGYFLLISPKQDEASETLEELDQTEFRNAQLQTDVNRLRGLEADLPQVREQIAQLQILVPLQDELTAYYAELIRLEEEHDVQLAQVNMSRPAQVTLIDVTDVDSESAPEPSGAPTPDPNATEEEAETPAPTQASDSIPGFFNLNVSYEVLGAPQDVLAFIHSVQTTVARVSNLAGVIITTQDTEVPANNGRRALAIGDVVTQVNAMIYIYAPEAIQEPGDKAGEESPATPSTPLPTLAPGQNPFDPIAVG